MGDNSTQAPSGGAGATSNATQIAIDSADGESLAEKLTRAARKGDLGSLRQLLPMADLSVVDQHGRNTLQAAIEAAVEMRRFECVEALLPLCDAKKETWRGGTLLIEAMAEGWMDGVRLLLPVSDADAKDRTSWTVLHRAAAVGRKEVALVLPAASPSVKDHRGRTALMIATMSASDAVETLIPVSDLRATDNDGNTALDLAVGLGNNATGEKIAAEIRKEMLIRERAELAAAVAQAGSEGQRTEAAEPVVDGEGKASPGKERMESGDAKPSRRTPKAL